MSKLSPNAACPCGSGMKYKKCCQKFHKGAVPVNALELMKSRYAAYAAGESGYIIKTTHPENPDYTDDRKKWKESIDAFSRDNEFLSLQILEFIDGENKAFVTFEALLSSGTLKEKSRFLKVNGIWLYHSGEIDISL